MCPLYYYSTLIGGGLSQYESDSNGDVVIKSGSDKRSNNEESEPEPLALLPETGNNSKDDQSLQ